MEERKRRIGRIFGLMILAIYTIAIAFPLYVTIISGFKDINDVFTIPPKLIPYVDFKPTLEPFVWIFSTRAGRTFIDSLICSVSSTALAVGFGFLSAYAYSRYPYLRGNGEGSFFFLLILRMFPPVAAALPVYLYWSYLHLYDTYPALIWTYTIFNIPLTVWLLRGFLDEIPKSLEDAALVDGMTTWQSFRKIVFPLLGAGLAATVALTWVFVWNEFLFALKLAGNRVLTYTAFLPQMRVGQRVQWNNIAGIGSIAVIAPIIILILFRKYVIRLYMAR
jgi:multiple sugar transport system permease protein